MPWILRMTLYLTGILIIPYIYSGWRLKNALTILFPGKTRLIKFIVFGLFAFANLLPVILISSYLTGQDENLFTHSAEFSILNILFEYPFWLFLIIIIEILPYYLVSDIALIIIKKWKPALAINWQKWIAVFKTAIILLFIFFVVFRVYWDTSRIKITAYDVPVDNLPPALQNLSLVLTADIQIDRYTSAAKITRIEEGIRGLNPDITFFAGDLVTSGTDFIDAGVNVLCNVPKGIARIACVGDHDYWADAGRIAREVRACGWDFLDNQHKIIEHSNSRILVTGVRYVYSKRITPASLRELLSAAPSADLKILLVHQPSQMVIEMAAEFGYHLLLAGHTHGGQLVFKPFGLTLTPTQVENNIYTGNHLVDKMNVIVSDGMGMSLVPLRYRAQAEIVKIKLVPGPGQSD